MATDHIMGHEIRNMSSVYRERISDEQLRAVTDYVRAWLLGDEGTKPVAAGLDPRNMQDSE
ncbi:MAG TPA: hypothetical protein VKU02_29430 [Gemmataceae bacterium]|nr:hypothetical protein [Gemmataceae bacterium]